MLGRLFVTTENQMRIAEIAPLYESVPPQFYGGTERVVSYLTEELVAQGHEVTLFASGDSKTSARLVSPCRRALRLDERSVDKLACHYAMIENVMEQAHEFDILHFHVDYLHFPFSRLCSVPHVTTLHGRLDIPELAPLYRRFPDAPIVSISLSQREPLPWIPWIGNVYHGLPPANLSLGSGKGKYLAFLGRIAREKRVDRAIQIALKSGMPLKIAAKVDPSDREYYKTEIKPLLKHRSIEYVGEIGEDQKSKFLGDAYAQVFPIDWPEPFGLCMIEAMACGTPTIAFDHGSVREVLTHGSSGFVVSNVTDAVAAVSQVYSLNRMACRREFERRFIASRMAEDYVTIYESLLSTDALAVRTPSMDSRFLSRTASV
jgi:glycosyltransferase involved in cell wall biosynthesis